MIRRTHLCAALAIFWLFADVAHADPVVVTSGSVFLETITGPRSFTIAGDGFSLSGTPAPGVPIGALVNCFPCAASPAVPLNVAAQIEGPFSPTPGMMNGISYSQLFLDGSINTHGPTFSSSSLSPTSLTFTTPFTMVAALVGFTSATDLMNRTNAVFNVALTGGGTATTHFIELPGPTESSPLFQFQNVTYTFEAGAAPTPEPGSVLLLASGLALTLARRRARQSRP